jgi:hypothetical protein
MYFIKWIRYQNKWYHYLRIPLLTNYIYEY